jgi:hypothetical protein
MVVRFDPDLIRDVVERRSDPIGVEGDPGSQQRGGVSEADKIIEDAKKSLEQEGETALNATISEELAVTENSSPTDPISPKGPDLTIDAKVAKLAMHTKDS